MTASCTVATSSDDDDDNCQDTSIAVLAVCVDAYTPVRTHDHATTHKQHTHTIQAKCCGNYPCSR